MFGLGFNEFLRNIKKNIFVIIQLILLYVVAFFIVSTVEEQLRIFNTINAVLDDTGIIRFDGGVNDNFEQGLVKVENIERPGMYGIVSGETGVDMITESRNYKMKLKSGKSSYSGNAKDGVIRALACTSTGLKPGDTYKMADYEIYVTGTYGPKEWVYGFFDSGTGEVDVDSVNYKMFFTTYERRRNNGIYGNYHLFIVNKEDFDREQEFQFSTFVIIDYEDDITKAEIAANVDYLRDNYMLIKNVDYVISENVYDMSVYLIKLKIMPLAVAFAIIFVFSLFSMIASSAIDFRYERRNYGIYFLTGNSWKNTIKLILVHWSVVIGVSLTVSVCGSLVLSRMKFMSDFNLEFSLIQIGVIAGIIVIQLLMALIIPWRMLRKTEPVTIIKESER